LSSKAGYGINILYLLTGPIAAIVCSVLWQACSVVMRSLRWYSTFSCAQWQYRAYYSDCYWAYDRVLERCFRGPENSWNVVKLWEWEAWLTRCIWWMPTECQVATISQTSLAHLCCESAYRMLLSTSTVVVYYYYYSAWKLIIILPSCEEWQDWVTWPLTSNCQYSHSVSTKDYVKCPCNNSIKCHLNHYFVNDNNNNNNTHCVQPMYISKSVYHSGCHYKAICLQWDSNVSRDDNSWYCVLLAERCPASYSAWHGLWRTERHSNALPRLATCQAVPHHDAGFRGGEWHVAAEFLSLNDLQNIWNETEILMLLVKWHYILCFCTVGWLMGRACHCTLVFIGSAAVCRRSAKETPRSTRSLLDVRPSWCYCRWSLICYSWPRTSWDSPPHRSQHSVKNWKLIYFGNYTQTLFFYLHCHSGLWVYFT